MDDGAISLPHGFHHRTTQGAEGLPRYFFSNETVRAMVEAGILPEDGSYELVGGELVPMSPKHNRHQLWKTRLSMRWSAALYGSPFILAPETSVFLSDGNIFEPDLVIYEARLLPEDVRGPDCRILVEVSDNRLAYDPQRKSPVYALHGIQEYWVLDARARRAHLFSEPRGDGTWGRAEERDDTDDLAPLAFPDLALKLTALDF